MAASKPSTRAATNDVRRRFASPAPTDVRQRKCPNPAPRENRLRTAANSASERPLCVADADIARFTEADARRTGFPRHNDSPHRNFLGRAS